MLISAEFFSNRLTGRCSASSLGISIMLFALDNLDDRLIYDLGKLESICSVWFCKTEVDHRLLVVLGEDHFFFEQLSDGVVHVGAGGWPVLHLRPG